jgi:hypothetical protein
VHAVGTLYTIRHGCQNLDSPSSPFRQVTGVAYGRGMRRGPCNGERTMTDLVFDILLFSSMFAFYTGIMIAAANFLI